MVHLCAMAFSSVSDSQLVVVVTFFNYHNGPRNHHEDKNLVGCCMVVNVSFTGVQQWTLIVLSKSIIGYNH